MNQQPILGTLTTLSAQEVWGSEPHVFTPWLANNLDLLAEALQLDELELRGTEVPAGDFRLDILAQDRDGNRVLIENQFGATDHRHLGQLVSYVASGSGRATVVWVAERFKDDHRAAIDWLNASTTEEFAFFAVEIEALRIGDSAPAPFFNVVAKPNSWTKSVRSTSAVAAGPVLAERHLSRIAYWASFSDYLKIHDPSFVIRRENKDHWFNFAIGRSGVVISTTITSQKRRASVELYLNDDPLKIGFRQLSADREAIDAAIPGLVWMELSGKKASRIAAFLHDVDPFDAEALPAIHAWMLDHMQRFRATFAARVKSLDLSGVDEEEAREGEIA